MKAWLFSWVRMLIISTVSMQLILQFVTEETYRKHIRMFLSMLFLLVLFGPVLSLGHLEQDMDDALADWTAKWEYKEIALGRVYTGQTGDDLLKAALQEKLREDISQLLAEEGLQMTDLRSDIHLEENDASIEKLTVAAAFAEDKKGSPSLSEDAVKNRLMKRYDLAGSQVSVSVRQ